MSFSPLIDVDQELEGKERSSTPSRQGSFIRFQDVDYHPLRFSPQVHFLSPTRVKRRRSQSPNDERASKKQTIELVGAEASKDISEGFQSSPLLPLTPEGRASFISARAVQPSRAFDSCKAVNSNRYVYSPRAPTVSELKCQLRELGLPSKIYQPPYYSKDSDIPEASKEYAGLTYRLKGGQGISWLEEWSTDQSAVSVPKSDEKIQLNHIGVGGWEYASDPPSMKEVRRSLATLLASPPGRAQRLRSQVKN